MEIRDIKEFYKNIDSYLDKKSTDRGLNRCIIEEFAKKGLSSNNAMAIINFEKLLESLSEFEKIAIGEACYNFSKIKELNPRLYFGADNIYRYEGCHIAVNEMDKIKLNGFVKKNKLDYRGNVSYKQIYDYLTAGLLFYNTDTQRMPLTKQIGKNVYKVPDLDQTAINSITDCILNNKFEDTEIVLNLRELYADRLIYEEKAKFDGVSVGNIEISNRIDIVDGMHRCLGIANAVTKHFAETGEYLQDKIGVRLVVRDVDGALRIVSQSFKRSDTNRDFKETIDENEYTLFVNEIVKTCKCLTNNISMTLSLAIAESKLANKQYMVQSVKNKNYDLNNLRIVTTKAKQIARNLDMILSEIEKIDNKTLTNQNIFALYFELACSCEEIDYDNLDNLINEIKKYDYDKDELNIKKDNCRIKNLIENYKEYLT